MRGASDTKDRRCRRLGGSAATTWRPGASLLARGHGLLWFVAWEQARDAPVALAVLDARTLRPVTTPGRGITTPGLTTAAVAKPGATATCQDRRLFMLAWSGREPVVRWRHGDREGRARSVRSAERLEGRGYAHALAPDASRLAVADAQGLAVLELTSGAVQRRARSWQGRVHLDFSDDGNTLVAADESAVTRHAAGDLSLVSRWSLVGSGIAADAGHGPPRASIVGVAAGGNWLYAERRDYGFRAFGLDPASDSAPWFTFGGTYEPLGVKTVHAFSGDGRTLALSREDAGEVHVVRDGVAVRTLSVDDVVRGLAVSDSGARVAVATGEDVRIYEGAGPPRPLVDSDIAPRRLAFDAGESRLIAHTEGRSLVVWSLTSGARLGVYGPADDLGAVDDEATRIAYWSGSTLHVAAMSAEQPETRDFQPCGPDCRLRAAGFMADGASLAVIYSVGAADRQIAPRIDSGSVRELPAAASRLVPPGFLRAGGFVMGADPRDFSIEHVQGGRALSVAVAGGLDGWAASTPGGIVDGRFARPWALALQSPGDRALFDISPFMAEARAPGMVPAMLRDGLPPACSVDFHAWRRAQAAPVPPTKGKALEKPEDE